MARGRLPEAVTAEDIIACGGREAPKKERREPPPQPPKAADIPCRAVGKAKAFPAHDRLRSGRPSAHPPDAGVRSQAAGRPELLRRFAADGAGGHAAVLPCLRGAQPPCAELVVTAVLCALAWRAARPSSCCLSVSRCWRSPSSRAQPWAGRPQNALFSRLSASSSIVSLGCLTRLKNQFSRQSVQRKSVDAPSTSIPLSNYKIPILKEQNVTKKYACC